MSTMTEGAPATPLTLQKAAEAVAKATADYSAARERSELAQRDERGALSRLNETQKAFEQTVNGFTKAAPRDSTWGRIPESARRPIGVAT